MQTAILIHCLDWASQSSEIDLGPGITLCQTEGSNVGKLYHKLCRTKGLDQGDPYHYPSHLRVDNSRHDEILFYWGGPHSVISACCNLIAVCIAEPLSCRLISSKDNFCTSWITTEIYEESEDAEILRARPTVDNFESDGSFSYQVECRGKLDDIAIQEVKKCWLTYSKHQKFTNQNNHRIFNALSYFFYAWRAYNLEQICINLAIVLESLFSPSQPQELSHQIAFNAAHFHADTPEKKEEAYKQIKKFYNLRSKIIHGGEAKMRDLVLLTPNVFHFSASVLKKILSEEDVAIRFSSEEKRKELIREWMFGPSE